MSVTQQEEIRKTQQYELPVKKENKPSGYDVYPTHNIGSGLIFEGYESLARELSNSSHIKIDGYVGVLFEDVKQQLNVAFQKIGIQPKWVNVNDALLSEEEVNQKVEPFLGGDDPIFGKLTHLQLIDFFNSDQLKALASENTVEPVIYYGVGASLVPVSGVNVYFEISKNEIQFRSRAGTVQNLGASNAIDPKVMYKRFYFVDWVVLNKHKQRMKNEIDLLVDGQRSGDITWMKGDDWRKTLSRIVEEPIRVRPWFEPGAWGGTWIKDKIEGLEKDVVNYAWSFELIVPENGVIIESSGLMLEYSFDFLMFMAGQKMLGSDYEQYGFEFPIRFDFLDTFDGGNLSVQCHPRLDYMKANFGENLTQEETYYILDCQNDAKVYLGFQEGVTPSVFQEALESSQKNKEEIKIEEYVQVFDAQKHDLYLIPPGTIHASGTDNLVLEISSTPYIYTFKMYDWLRLDLDGNPRPMNIQRGMENLVFERSGKSVKEELISKPYLLDKSENWELYHLPTHKDHLYDVHRYVIQSEVTINTENKAHVLSLVEGDQIRVTTKHSSKVFKYAETFVIPAATNEYVIENLSPNPALVVKAFIK
ncbi:class I mannose-6-phosphate isomerase [Marinoscillum sp.]|uniref:class I mannose-6-phosphate isomerase n=1 Tax=Marinoscillum sp. TaxID=2024838 RepID=UPI003BABC7B6